MLFLCLFSRSIPINVHTTIRYCYGINEIQILKKLCCTERNSELSSLPRKGSERNSENLHLFWFHGTEFRVVFSSAEGFGTEFRDFLFRGRTGIPSEITICSDYSVFRGIIFLAEIPNPRYRVLSWGGGGMGL
jgi:hypothetical protein